MQVSPINKKARGERITIAEYNDCIAESYGPFLRMEFNWLKARATSRRQFTNISETANSTYFLESNVTAKAVYSN